jgi:hypothetical protein
MAKVAGSLFLFTMLCAPFSFPQGEREDQADPSTHRSSPGPALSDRQRPYLAAEEAPKTTNNLSMFTRLEPIAPISSSIVSRRLEIAAAPAESRMDWKFGIVAALAIGSTIADLEATLHCPQPCREVDPLYGAHPTRARLYGTSAPYLSWRNNDEPSRAQAVT